MIRCLIPITQEKRNENSLKRACVICDRIHLLYVVDTEILERMERESAYVLNSEMLDALRQTLIESQRREAESIIEDMKCRDKVKLHFEVGDYFEVVERYVLKTRPHIIMSDSVDRKFFNFNIPLWVDAGNEIKNIVFVAEKAYNVTRMLKNVEFSAEISRRLRSRFSVYTENPQIKEILEKRFEISRSLDGELISLDRIGMKRIHPGKTYLFLK